jgi:hypothetical protein
VTPNSFFRNAQLSYNPNYYWWFNFAPRWYLDSATFLFVSLSLFYELTNDDGSSAYNHDVQLGDPIVEIRQMVGWEGFVFIPAARVILPASKLSQAAQRYLGVAGGMTVVRSVPEAAGLTIALIGRYQYWFAGSNVPRFMGGVPGHTDVVTPATHMQAPVGSNDGTRYLDAPMIDQAVTTSQRHLIVAGLTVNVTPVQNLTFSLAAFWVSTEGHGLAPACFHALTSPSQECIGDNQTHWRHFTWGSLSAAYDVETWLNFSIGYQTAAVLAPLFNDDGSLRSPFNPDANFFFTATVQVDALYEALFRGEEEEGLTPEERQRRRQGLARRPSVTGGSL